MNLQRWLKLPKIKTFANPTPCKEHLRKQMTCSNSPMQTYGHVLSPYYSTSSCCSLQRNGQWLSELVANRCPSMSAVKIRHSRIGVLHPKNIVCGVSKDYHWMSGSKDPLYFSYYLKKDGLLDKAVYSTSLQSSCWCKSKDSPPQCSTRELGSDVAGRNTDPRPSVEHLEDIYNRLSISLPRFFVQAHDYSIYHKDIEFINNIKGTRTRGISAYIKQLAWVRILAHLKFAYVKMDVLKITKRPEDGSVIVRWRIRGVSGLKVMLQFWKYKPWELRKIVDKETNWYDGISFFYLGSDGLIHRHVCDKVIPEENVEKISTPII